MATFYAEVSRRPYACMHADIRGGNLSTPMCSQISSIQDSIATFNQNIKAIGELHSQSLNNMDDAAAQRNAAQMDELVEDTSALSTTLKRRVKALEAQGGSGRDGQIKKQQVSVICA